MVTAAVAILLKDLLSEEEGSSGPSDMFSSIAVQCIRPSVHCIILEEGILMEEKMNENEHQHA